MTTDLATQIEQAGPEQQREMLGEAFDVIFPIDWASADKEQEKLCTTFEALLAIGTDEAFTGAALMLVPEGWEWGIDQYHIYGSEKIIQGHAIIHDGEPLRSVFGPIKAATPALAIAAVCVRAHDKEKE